MTEVLIVIIYKSIAAGWMILAVLAARLVLQRAPKWVNVLLWGIVAVRLLCPFSIESDLSLVPRLQAGSDSFFLYSKADTGADIGVDTGADTKADTKPGEKTEYLGEDRKNNSPTKGNSKEIARAGDTTSDAEDGERTEGRLDGSWRASLQEKKMLLATRTGTAAGKALTVIWLIGVLLLISLGIIRYRRLCRQVACAIRLRDNIFQSEYIAFPFVLGVRRPRIYLPYGMESWNLEYVISHEKAHIRRGDHIWKLLGALLASIYWFHPLVWLAYTLLCQDMELACDEAVIRRLDRGGRADYSQALLVCSVSQKSRMTYPLAFGETGVKKRVKSVLRYQKPACWGVAAAVGVCILVAVCFLTDPAQGNAKEKEDGLAGLDTTAIDTTDVESSEKEAVNKEAGEVDATAVGEKDSEADEAAGDSGADKEITDMLVWETSDLDQDGETEQIRVRKLGTELYELYVVKQNGAKLWSVEAGISHTGWNTLFLYQSEGKDYLVQYQPTMYQGLGSYTCTMFSLEGGSVTVENEWSTEFSMPVEQLTWKMRGFAENVNAMLENGTVLLSTEQGELVLGPKPGAEAAQIYPVLFDPNEREAGLEREQQPEELPADSRNAQEGEPVSVDRLPFEAPSLTFWLASGAGGWRTELTVYPDGRFEGDYQDGETSAGPDYPNGSAYVCRFHGQFDQIEAVSRNVYRMQLKELVYETEVDDVWIEEGVRYIGSEAYGLKDGEEFFFYLPDTSPGELNEAYLSWWPDRHLWEVGSIQTLLSYGIWNVETEEGFFSSWLD